MKFLELMHFFRMQSFKERRVEINREKRYMDGFISFLKLLTREVNGFVFLICQLIVFIVWMVIYQQEVGSAK